MSKSEQFISGLENYIEATRRDLHTRWDTWKYKPDEAEMYEVIGSLMARQVSITNQIAMNPGTWNGKGSGGYAANGVSSSAEG